MDRYDDERRAHQQDLIRQHWKKDAVAQKLIESGTLAAAIKLLEGRKRSKRYESRITPLDIWIVQATQRAAGKRDVAETMTAGQRKKLSDKIINSANSLQEALMPFSDESGMRWPFQPVFDGLALDAACNQRDWMKECGVEFDDELIHRCRSAVYRLLMHDLGTLLDTIKEGADMFASQETVIKKPNDQNVDRLYFIRTLNKSFCAEFDSPCRSAALTITSAFFDCSDLDEATLSKLAPHHRTEPAKLPPEAVEKIRALFREAGQPCFLDEIDDNKEPE